MIATQKGFEDSNPLVAHLVWTCLSPAASNQTMYSFNRGAVADSVNPPWGVCGLVSRVID